MKIVELDGYAANPGDISWDGLKELGELTIYPRTAPEEVVERAKEADAILINKVNITEAVLEQLPKLKYIGVLATGYNVVDVEAAHKRGVVVTNIPSYSTESVVQMTFAHIFNITNQVAHYGDASRQGRWSANPDFCYWDTPLMELSGKTLGIVGLGHIGQRVAAIAHQFGMDVFAVTSKDAMSLPKGIQKTTLDGLLGVADIISLHCPLTKDNYHLIDAEKISRMREGAILINTARGALVDEQAIADALESGHLAGYGADVMEQEPPRKRCPLFSQPHASVWPHIAWATQEARERLMRICVDNVRAFKEGKPINEV